jgi:hypothetical protein
MSENTASKPTIHESERTYLGKLLLAAKVILEAAPDLSLVSDPLEVELGIQGPRGIRAPAPRSRRRPPSVA